MVFSSYLLLARGSSLLQRPDRADVSAHLFQVLVPVVQEPRQSAAVLPVLLFDRAQDGLFLLLQGQTHDLESLTHLLLHRLRARLDPENRDGTERKSVTDDG